VSSCAREVQVEVYNLNVLVHTRVVKEKSNLASA
jgi:hypothetical protein